MQIGVHCGPIVQMRVFEICVDKGFVVHEIVEIKEDHRTCHVRLVK
jgi:hypothetical protein